MNTEIKEHARQMFTAVMVTGKGIGYIPELERKEMLKQVAELCFEAAIVFEKVAITNNS